jgi:hypothetical protein
MPSSEPIAGHLNLVREAARANDLGEYAARIATLVRPSVVIATTRAKASSFPVGASRIGGRPDVPQSFEWPTWQRQPLSFLGQLNLAELKTFQLGLPDEGLLSFFYCFDASLETARPQRGGAGRVFFFQDASLQRRKPSRAADNPFEPCSVRYIGYPSLPSAYADQMEELWGMDFLADDDLREAYAEVIHSIDEALGINALSTAGGYNYHQVLGFPAAVQFTPIEVTMERARNLPRPSTTQARRDSLWEQFKNVVLPRKPQPVSLPSAEPSAPLDVSRCRDWRLLLMLQEDEHADIRLVDSGRLYFMYPGERFHASDFGDPWTMVDFG